MKLKIAAAEPNIPVHAFDDQRELQVAALLNCTEDHPPERVLMCIVGEVERACSQCGCSDPIGFDLGMTPEASEQLEAQLRACRSLAAGAPADPEPIRVHESRVIVAQGKGNDSVLWFTEEGMGPNPTEWTVNVFEPPGPGGTAHVGVQFHGEGGPFMSPDTAETIGTWMIAAARHARRAELAGEVEGKVPT